ncbi:MAG: hypothetical protein WC666_01120 [Candidatus Paceibacterota bacterium]|jgi:hypothetical protein
MKINTELIVLDTTVKNGFVVYGFGSGAYHHDFQGMKLIGFLDEFVQREMREIKRDVNSMVVTICNPDSDKSKRDEMIEKCLSYGQWAFAMAMTLIPLSQVCADGPTDPMGVLIIKPLEEIFTKCFALAHVYGNVYQQIIGMQGLMTDFFRFGGIKPGTTEIGTGFKTSLNMYYMAYINKIILGNNPQCYDRYADLLIEIFEQLVKDYPQAGLKMSKYIKDLITSLNMSDDYPEFFEQEAKIIERFSTVLDVCKKELMASVS